MNHKIFIRLLSKKGQTLEFSRDYDEFVREANIERRYNVRNMLTALCV